MLASDPSGRIKKEVCASFLYLGSVRIEYILAHFHQVVPIMLAFTKDEEEEVALEACEFWNVVCDHGNAKDALRPHLSQYVLSSSQTHQRAHEMSQTGPCTPRVHGL